MPTYVMSSDSSIDPEADTSPESDADDVDHSAYGHVSLGPFELVEPIGRGGMGEVWRGRHRREDVPVAAKMITASRATEAKHRRRFRDEVRSIATLNHPGIVTVLDYGDLPEETEADSSGHFREGTPYFVMGLADAGSMEQHVGDLSWASLHSALLSILDALSHAHARHIVHRDLKPANLLLQRTSEETLQIKVSDFGLAFLRDRALADERTYEEACGTPYYMAPEQIQTYWREYGPWTDLYALGCLAWELTTGRPPYRGDSFPAVARKHVHESLPTYDPVVPVPPAFERWLLRLLAKHPSDRFQTTAAASWSLMMIGDEVPREGQRSTRPEEEIIDDTGAFPTLQSLAEQTLRADGDPETLDAIAPQSEREGPAAHGESDHTPIHHDRPPLPVTWTERKTTSTPVHLLGAGLELFDLREMPLVDRQSERDLLWHTFVESVKTDTARVVMLQGASGTGKSRLARWVRERAHQLGAAHTMEARHASSKTPRDGLVPMLSRFFGCTGLDRDEVERHLQRWMDNRDIETSLDWGRLADLVAPRADRDETREHGLPFASVDERREYLRRVLLAVARDRPLVVHLDDLQWGRSTMEFLLHVLRHPAPEAQPIYFVTTVREDALAERDMTRQLADELADRERVSVQTVESLDELSHRVLVERLLKLDPSLTHKVAERSNGNPLFAIQLIKDWADRRLLEVDDEGFVLRDDADSLLPDDLFEIWEGRLERILDAHDDDARLALELAAALGRDVDEQEWLELCRSRDLDTCSALIDDLLRNQLIETTEQGWSFTHDMLRETLERLARDADRWSDHNRACAELVESETERQDIDRVYRLAHYHLAAGEMDAAIDPLLTAFEQCGRLTDLETAVYLERQLEDTLAASDLPDDDIRRGEYTFLRARLEMAREIEPARARTLLEEALSFAMRYGHRSLLYRVFHGLGRLNHGKTAYDRALMFYNQARATIDPETHSVEYGRLMRSIGETYARSCEIERARRALHASIDTCDEFAPVERAKAEHELGRLFFGQESYDEAERYLKRAFSTFEAENMLLGQAKTLNALADIDMERNHLRRARERYDRALELARLTRSHERITLEISRTHLALEADNYRGARRHLTRIDETFDIESRPFYRFFVDVMELQCRLALDDRDVLDEQVARLRHYLGETKIATRSHVKLLTKALEMAKEQDRLGQMEDLPRLTARRWDNFGGRERAEEICECFGLDVSEVLDEA